MQKKIIISMILVIIFTGCNSSISSTGPNSNPNSQNIITSNIYEGNYY